MNRTTFAAASLAALLLTAPALATTAHNQLHNPGFEAWPAEAAVPDAWTLEIGTLERAAGAPEGDAAVQLRAKPNPDGSHLSILAQTLPQGEATDLPIVAGQWYELTFQARGEYNGKGSGMATVTWTGALGSVLRVDTIAVAESAAWQAYDVHLQAPADPLVPDAATQATLRFVVDGQSSDDKVNLFADDVAFGLSGPL